MHQVDKIRLLAISQETCRIFRGHILGYEECTCCNSFKDWDYNAFGQCKTVFYYPEMKTKTAVLSFCESAAIFFALY